MDRILEGSDFPSSNNEIIFTLCLSAMFWYIVCRSVILIFPIKHSNKKKVDDSHLRIVNGLQSFFIVLVSIHYVYTTKLGCNIKNSPYLRFWILWSMGYHIYDLIIFKSKDILLFYKILHHSFTLIGQTESILKDTGGTIMLSMSIWLEISVPFLQLRKVLLNLNLKETKLYIVNELLYIAAYLISWTIYTLNCYKYYSTCSDNLYVLRISVVGLNLQAFYLIYQMAELLKCRWSEYKERYSKSIGLLWFSVNPKTASLDYVKRPLNSN